MNNSNSKSQLFQLWVNRKKQIISIIIIVMVIFILIFTTREPEVSVRAIRVKQVSLSWITFEVTLDVNNGNIIGGTLNSLEADIYYNDDYIGLARTTRKYDIKPLGESTLRIDLRIDNLPSDWSIPPKIRAKGTANISVFFLSFDKEIDETVIG